MREWGACVLSLSILPSLLPNLLRHHHPNTETGERVSVDVCVFAPYLEYFSLSIFPLALAPFWQSQARQTYRLPTLGHWVLLWASFRLNTEKKDLLQLLEAERSQHLAEVGVHAPFTLRSRRFSLLSFLPLHFYCLVWV